MNIHTPFSHNLYSLNWYEIISEGNSYLLLVIIVEQGYNK